MPAGMPALPAVLPVTKDNAMNEAKPRAQAVADGARQLPAEQRAGYIRAACGGDAELEQRVEALLQAEPKAAAPKAGLPRPSRPST